MNFFLKACTPNPCLNGGVCQSSGNTYQCNCTGTGFIGTTCQIGMVIIY